MVTHKTELEVIDGTPENRSFLSQLSDYNLKIGIFELVDNAIDFWTRGSAISKLHIDIRLDADRHVLCVREDAGGVQRKDTRLLISSGAAGNPANVEVIGIFSHILIAFGPPGEYGEIAIHVPIDRGQPYEVVWS